MRIVAFLILIQSSLIYAQNLEFDISKKHLEEVSTNLYLKKRYNKFKKKHASFLYTFRNNLSYWDDMEVMAERWGYLRSGFYLQPSMDARKEVIKDELFRFIKKVSKDPLKQQVDQWRLGLKRDYEIDTRSLLLGEGNVFIYDEAEEKRQSSRRKNRKKKKKKTTEFKFKPYPLRGLLIAQFRSSLFNLDGLAAVNRTVEFRVSRYFRRLKLKAGTDYRLNDNHITVYSDKRFGKFLKLRFSAEKNLSGQETLKDSLYTTLNYFRKF